MEILVSKLSNVNIIFNRWIFKKYIYIIDETVCKYKIRFVIRDIDRY